MIAAPNGGAVSRDLGGRPPRVTFAQYRRIVAVRRARESIPSDKELAVELGLNPTTVGNLVRRGLKTYEKLMQRKAPK